MSDFSPEWLGLREPADADARADELLTTLRSSLTSEDLLVRDLGSGTGSRARWLSPRLPNARKWILTDLDPALLAVATASVPGATSDLRDITTLSAAELSGEGRVELTPAYHLDEPMTAGFNAHQRRTVAGRALLGPSAVPAMATAFTRLGGSVHSRTRPRHLGPDRRPLLAEWLRGWVSAACEQNPDLRPEADGYHRRRLSQEDLHATVHHEDLLAIPY